MIVASETLVECEWLQSGLPPQPVLRRTIRRGRDESSMSPARRITIVGGALLVAAIFLARYGVPCLAYNPAPSLHRAK